MAERGAVCKLPIFQWASYLKTCYHFDCRKCSIMHFRQFQANLSSIMAKVSCSLRSQGGLIFPSFVPGPPKLLGGPCVGVGIGNRALLNESQKLEEKSVMNFIYQTLFPFQLNASIVDTKNHERMLSSRKKTC